MALNNRLVILLDRERCSAFTYLHVLLAVVYDMRKIQLISPIIAVTRVDR